MDWVASLAFDEFSTTTDMNLSWEKATKYPQLEAEGWSNARDERNLDSDSLVLNSSIFFLTLLLFCCRCRKMCVCVCYIVKLHFRHKIVATGYIIKFECSETVYGHPN